MAMTDAHATTQIQQAEALPPADSGAGFALPINAEDYRYVVRFTRGTWEIEAFH